MNRRLYQFIRQKRRLVTPRRIERLDAGVEVFASMLAGRA